VSSQSQVAPARRRAFSDAPLRGRNRTRNVGISKQLQALTTVRGRSLDRCLLYLPVLRRNDVGTSSS